MTKDILYCRAMTCAISVISALVKAKPKHALMHLKRTEREIKKAMGCPK